MKAEYIALSFLFRGTMWLRKSEDMLPYLLDVFQFCMKVGNQVGFFGVRTLRKQMGIAGGGERRNSGM